MDSEVVCCGNCETGTGDCDVNPLAAAKAHLPAHDFTADASACRFCHIPSSAVEDGFAPVGCAKRAEWIATYGEPA